MKKIALEAKLMARLVQVHQEFLDGIEDLKEQAKDNREFAKKLEAHLSRINQLPKGPKGDSIIGPRGLQGKPGKNGETPDVMEIATLAASLIPKESKVEEVETPEDEEQEMQEIATRVAEILGFDDKFKRVTNEMASYRSQLAGKIYGKDTWARGGGGSSSSGGGVSITTPTGDVDAVNVTFTASATPLWVTADGIQYFEGAGYSLAGPTITMEIPPSQYIRTAIATT